MLFSGEKKKLFGYFLFSDMYMCSTILKKEKLDLNVMYFSKSTLLLLVIFLVSLVFADFIIGFLGDASLMVLQQIQLILNFYLQL